MFIQTHVAKNAPPLKRFFCAGPAVLSLVFGSLSVTGCVGSGLSLDRSPDRSLITGAIATDDKDLSDEDRIRLAVASADTQDGAIQDIPWTNPQTGDGGTVSYVQESGAVGQICREFIVSKHSYDGVSQYLGEICRPRLGNDWTLKSIERQD